MLEGDSVKSTGKHQSIFCRLYAWCVMSTVLRKTAEDARDDGDHRTSHGSAQGVLGMEYTTDLHGGKGGSLRKWEKVARNELFSMYTYSKRCGENQRIG